MILHAREARQMGISNLLISTTQYYHQHQKSMSNTSLFLSKTFSMDFNRRRRGNKTAHTVACRIIISHMPPQMSAAAIQKADTCHWLIMGIAVTHQFRLQVLKGISLVKYRQAAICADHLLHLFMSDKFSNIESFYFWKCILPASSNSLLLENKLLTYDLH